MSTLRLKQELYSFAHTVYSCMLLSLVLGGIGGTVYKVLSPDGWVARMFGHSLSAAAAALGAMGLVGGLAWFSRSWGDPEMRSLPTQILVYGFAAVGALYLAQMWTRGTL
jgi:FtsH-binding integral membrane protein